MKKKQEVNEAQEHSMKRGLVLCVALLLSPCAFGLGEMDPAAVYTIASAELVAMKLPARSPFCLAIQPARNMSKTGADPSREMVQFLKQKHLRTRKVSACYNPFPNGNVISIEPTSESGNHVIANVSFAAFRQDEDLGIIHRRGVYKLAKNDEGEWMIESYASELPGGEPTHNCLPGAPLNPSVGLSGIYKAQPSIDSAP